MPLTINTNIASIGAQRNLTAASAASSSSLSKLTSGSRVPTAKDDAAALAIGSKLRAEVAGLRQASQNAAQAVSLLQIADGALSTVGDILVRLKSLAVQSSSGQLGSSERGLLNQEYSNLLTEVGRIALDTDFNGTQLLNGGNVAFDIDESNLGFLFGNGVSVAYDSDALPTDSVLSVSYEYVNAGTDQGNLTVTNLSTGESQTVDIYAQVNQLTNEGSGGLTTDLSAGQSIDVSFSSIGVTLTVDDRFDVNGTALALPTALDGSVDTAQAAVQTNAVVNILPNGDISGAEFAALTTIDTNTGLLTLNVADNVDDVLTFSATAGLEFSSDGVNFGATLAATADGSTASVVYVRAGSSGEAFATIDLGAVDIVGASGGASNTIQLDVSALQRVQETAGAAVSFSFKVGTGVQSQDDISISIGAVTTAQLGISSTDITTAANAGTAIGLLDTAINTVSGRRADIGASQSRLEFAAASVAVAIENTTAAQSGLLDVDVSSEITNFTNKQVLLQAGISLLAQANQQPALLLRLLQ